jgi:hypothetical protein
VMADQARNIGIVFDDEKAGLHGIIVNGKQLPAASCQLPEAGSYANFIGL